MTDILKIKCDLKKTLKPERFEHTLGVMYTASALAMCHGADIDKALLAGALHDCAKCCSNQEQQRKCVEYGIVLTPSEREMPVLIHAKLGAYLAEREYHITDREIRNAILYHTTGRPHMTLMEKIIYLADYMEPGRKWVPRLKEIRYTAFHDIDKAVCLSAEATLSYLKREGRTIDPMTVETYKCYEKRNGE